ncbi:TRAP transporter small permease [Oceanobacillus damuensis]|uniref:TRAP transporter small permease n=1 Tax=Oceanobacillus damuensis TaxID=937928 RepID=UPI00082BB88F|nr:TRAP transporter small permease [Oceanobacillus damuensis]
MTLKRLDAILGRLLEIIITACLGAVVIITFLQVLFRYVLQQPLTWSQEALMISFVYSVLFGAALAIKNNDHLKVDLFEKMPSLLRKLFMIVEFIVVGILIITLFYYGYLLVMSNLESGQILGILPIKKAYVYMAIPLSALFMLYYHIKKVLK